VRYGPLSHCRYNAGDRSAKVGHEIKLHTANHDLTVINRPITLLITCDIHIEYNDLGVRDEDYQYSLCNVYSEISLAVISRSLTTMDIIYGGTRTFFFEWRVLHRHFYHIFVKFSTDCYS